MAPLSTLTPGSRFRIPSVELTGVVEYQGESGTVVTYDRIKHVEINSRDGRTARFERKERTVISSGTLVETL